MLNAVSITDLLSKSCVLTDLVANNKLEVIQKMTDLFIFRRDYI